MTHIDCTHRSKTHVGNVLSPFNSLLFSQRSSIGYFLGGNKTMLHFSVRPKELIRENKAALLSWMFGGRNAVEWKETDSLSPEKIAGHLLSEYENYMCRGPGSQIAHASSTVDACQALTSGQMDFSTDVTTESRLSFMLPGVRRMGRAAARLWSAHECARATGRRRLARSQAASVLLVPTACICPPLTASLLRSVCSVTKGLFSSDD
jgi:hypothetical protein